MPLIRIVYRANKYGFDYVTGGQLDTLIAQDGITHFYRPLERRWINIRLNQPGKGQRGRGPGTRAPEEK